MWINDCATSVFVWVKTGQIRTTSDKTCVYSQRKLKAFGQAVLLSINLKRQYLECNCMKEGRHFKSVKDDAVTREGSYYCIVDWCWSAEDKPAVSVCQDQML